MPSSASGALSNPTVTSSGSTSILYPEPIRGASILLAFRPISRTFLVFGSNRLAAVRVLMALEADASVIVASHRPLDMLCDELRWRICERKQARYVKLPGLDADENHYHAAVRGLLDELEDVALACVTDSLLLSDSMEQYGKERERAIVIHRACKSRRIPINVTDVPALCDFTFPSTHRFNPSPSTPSLPSPLSSPALNGAQPSPPLQIAVTTNGQGCRLAGRVRREISTKLHPKLGDAVANVARLRAIAKNHDSGTVETNGNSDMTGEEDEGAATSSSLNRPVPQIGIGEGAKQVEEAEEIDPMERIARRMRWVNQISEYWPVERLAALKEDEMQTMLELGYGANGTVQARADSSAPIAPHEVGVGTVTRKLENGHASSKPAPIPVYAQSRHALPLQPPSWPNPPRGQILLVGAGPGHPSMLTVAARRAITELATRVLSDKLVPAEVLALIPDHVPLTIAKKYPGNAEGAQAELMQEALDSARRGEIIVRLKQGDPFLYGRGGEEVLFFRKHGFEPLVIPGVSSALAGPSFVGIPVTQRGAAESLVICTGVGRGGKSVSLPPYLRSRTLVILMGVARLSSMLFHLQEQCYPHYMPIAVVERASSPDQRLIASTLEGIERMLASSEVGEQRTPGMIVVGWAVLSLDGMKGDLELLDDASRDGSNKDELEEMDKARIGRWLGRKCGIVRDGLPAEWEQFV